MATDEENAKNPWWPPESKPEWKPVSEFTKKLTSKKPEEEKKE